MPPEPSCKGFLPTSPPGPPVLVQPAPRVICWRWFTLFTSSNLHEGRSLHPWLTVASLSGKATVVGRAKRRELPVWQHHTQGVQIQELCTSIRCRLSTEHVPDHPIVAHNLIHSDDSWTTSTTSLFKRRMNYWWCSGALLNCLVGQQEHSVVQTHQNE